ncbi:phosphomannomutase/phosphoglucomutase [Candidatus Falkowbacteria bacterium HGW-Falkowbacteria-2]|uniref:Phosphomannomutase/phosphoglucomutase n=1 Tax=Candidatus Falkowbacteria bacterium HGW-Falkowbacteria-2 TaxID=2013769 RepID=A0A2N2DX69_9BACT|nr:MAG: phosphomannomutase/phosphoglucomutase [Candidatus Falkowbacteria bacterium HGW-Falkowbacteria-2]
MFNPSIFKAYDIRGIYETDFDLAFVARLAHAFAALRRADGDTDANKPLTIIVARDMRLSSPAISAALIAGLQSAGVKVIDAGLLSTPAFYFTVSNQKADGGIMVSASHNPKEWNGFKLVRAMSRPISGDSGINWMRDEILKSEEFDIIEEELHPVETLANAAEAQLEHDLTHINVASIKPMRIVADAANSMGAQYLELLASKLPVQLEKLNFTLDGSFPAHEADPLKSENLEALSQAVKNSGADLGIATDGDGDRVFFVDEKGDLVDPAIIRGLLAQIFLKEKPGSKIGYDVRPGKITVDLITANGGVPVPSRVGHSLIKEQMLAENAYFAGESSGHFFLNLEIGCFEMPMIMIGKLLALFSQSNMSVSEFLKPYRRYFHSGEINRSVKDKDKIFQALQDSYKDGEKSLLDGISITYPNFWFNVRGSNTEDKVRLNLEADSFEVMVAKRDEVLKLIENT